MAGAKQANAASDTARKIERRLGMVRFTIVRFSLV
jgi:hypothetical protein